MTTYGIPLAATIILLLPMMYFLLASPTFLLRSLVDPVVTWLLRALFNFYFSVVTITCVLGATAFALAGRPPVAIGLSMVAALAIGARRWFLSGLDTEIRARDAGDATALRRLRRLHWGGMLYNAVQVAAIVGSIPLVFPAAR